MEQFDPYRAWLGIPPNEQPPNLYRLLGVAMFEANPEVIATAAERQSDMVQAYQIGPNAEVAQFMLNELAEARMCLLDPRRKSEYDLELQQGLSIRGERLVASPPPPAMNQPSAGAFIPQQPAFGPGGPGYAGPGFGGTAGPREAPLPTFGLPPGGLTPGSAPMPAANLAASPMPGYPAPMAGQFPGPHMNGPAPMPMARVMPVAAPGAFASALPMGGHAEQVPGLNAVAGAGAAVAFPGPPVSPPPAPESPLNSLIEDSAAPPARRKWRRHKKAGLDNTTIVGGAIAAGVVLIGVLIASNMPKHGYEHAVEKEKTSAVEAKSHKATTAAQKVVSKSPRSDTKAKPPSPNSAIARPNVRPRAQPFVTSDPAIDSTVGPPAIIEGPEPHAPLQVPRHGLDGPGGPPAPIDPAVRGDPPAKAKPQDPPQHPHLDLGPDTDDTIGLPPQEK